MSVLASVVVCTVLMLVSTTADQIDRKQGPCIMPPFPAHGSYLSSPKSSPGDQLENAVLNITCDADYHLVGERTVTCISDWWSDDMPECLPFCKAGKKSWVVGCDSGASQCVITPSNLPSLGHRTLSQNQNCGTVGPITDRIIAGGYQAVLYDAPWHAGLYTKATMPYMQICGGTLIARDVVVTAAHCFSTDGSTPSAANYAIAVGKIYRPWNNDHDKQAQKSDVKEIRIPPRYLGSVGNFQDDIALVIVAKKFDYTEAVTPACVSFDRKFDEEQLQEGKYGKVFGWGLTGENAKSSQVLLVADVPYVDIRKCIKESPVSFRTSITSDKFCAGYTNGTAVCRGDSGGGLMFSKMVKGKERFFLRGIVSTSPSTENACNIFAWAAFTHILKHEGFLKTVVGSKEEAPVPVDVVHTPVSSGGQLRPV
ncbi:hypothetical protein O3G_MSEX011977 [Manduca sexta]|uniref:Uncharacterized protein n=2 Tax=Manduca sexta TaxID=7130 RepID=A0A921ZNH5_MANSE|nr:hypothetical protein O3G_MSEX011977 [Manduca sexta]KAG6460418.1 hypothetical protein O3G_MSEX011977 [Manduca sexta]KAG6460419.1 hypothetical protein O3G_MSEX011977 [Manduca sexta]